MPEFTTPDFPHNFEVRIKGRIDASNLTHADFVVRNSMSFTPRLWDAIDDFVVEVTPDPINTLRRINRDQHTP